MTVPFRIVMNKHEAPRKINTLLDINKSVNAAIVNNEVLYLRDYNIYSFVLEVLSKLGERPINLNYSAEILIKLCKITHNDYPFIELNDTKEIVNAEDLPIMMGVGSNNLDLGDESDYIIETMKFWKKENLERIYVEVNGVEKFTYYIDLRNKKRYLKNPDSIKSFVHFDILKKKEMSFLKVLNEEDVYLFREKK